MPHYNPRPHTTKPRTYNIKNAHTKTQSKISINTSDTALHLALKHQNYKTALELIDHGADVNIKNHDGYTAMDIILRQDKKDAINLIIKLIDHGANINTQNHDGNTALHLALKHHNNDIAIKLIDHGADVNIKNNKGETPLHIVSQHRDQYADNIAIKLIEHGADANIKNHNGETALHIVSQRHDIYAPKMAVTLMEHGSDINIKNNSSNIKETLQSQEIISDNTSCNAATDEELIICINITQPYDPLLGAESNKIDEIFDK